MKYVDFLNMMQQNDVSQQSIPTLSTLSSLERERSGYTPTLFRIRKRGKSKQPDCPDCGWVFRKIYVNDEPIEPNTIKCPICGFDFQRFKKQCKFDIKRYYKNQPKNTPKHIKKDILFK